MDQRRTHRRLGVFVATGVVAVGLAAFPAFTFAEAATATATGTGTATATPTERQRQRQWQRERPRQRPRRRQRHWSRPCRDLPHPSGQPGQRAHDHGRRTRGRCSHGQPRRPVGAVRDHHHDTEAPSERRRRHDHVDVDDTVALQPTVTVSYTPTVDHARFCSVVIDLTGFGPSQSYDVTLVHSSPIVHQCGITVDLQQRSDGRRRRGPLRRFQLLPEPA